MKNHTKIQSFFKHIHFVISSINNDYWKKQIFTKLVHNNYKYHKFMKLLKSKEAIILNVLPCDIYAKDLYFIIFYYILLYFIIFYYILYI